MRSKLRFWKSYRPVLAYSSRFHLEAFLVTSIVTVITIRLFLRITGFPQVGGGGLHIAHLLWGGLLMLSAIVIQLTFLGDRPRGFTAFLGGVGFGFFIDELGKYITQNNNYFFKPAVLLIYGVFLVLWLAFDALEDRGSTSSRAKSANVFELLEEGMLYGYNRQERRQLNRLLAELKESKSELAPELAALAAKVEKAAPTDAPSLYIRLLAKTNEIYTRLVEWPYFGRFLVLVFLVQGILSLASLVDFAQDIHFSHLLSFDSEKHIAETGQLLGGLVYAAIIIAGLLKLRTERYRAYVFFKRALLINIFVTQFFALYRLQFAAVSGLLFNLVLLGAVNYMLRLELSDGEGG